MTANLWYELINNACECCTSWQDLFERGAHRVLTTVDPWREYRLSHEDYYRYISYIKEEDYE